MARTADDLPLRVAQGMLWASFGILVYIRTMSGVSRDAAPLALLLTMASYPPLIAILARHRRPAVRYGLLAALVLLYLLPFFVVGSAWDWMPWTVAAGVLCVLPARPAWPLFGLVVAATGTTAALLGYGVYDSVWFVIVTADDALIVFSLAALVRTVRRLHDAQGELARLALLRERLRLDGELRNVLGGKLRAIAFRMRKAAAFQTREAPVDARQDIREGVGLARRTLAEVRATAGAYRADPIAEPAARIESPRLARFVLLAVLLIQCVLVLLNLYYWEHAAPQTLAWALLGLIGIVILQVAPQTRVTFVVQGLLFLLPLAVIPGSWDRVLSFFTGKVLLTVRPPRSWAIAGAVLAGHLAWLLYDSMTAGTGVLNGLANFGGHVMLAWLAYSLGRLSGLITVLDRARHELAEAAVRRERTRIARDLHDVLGFSLSAVALKGELAERLLDTDPDRARTELASLVSLVERALVELGSIAGDRVELRLAAELDAAREVLTAAGIEATARVTTGPLPAGVDTAVATALRETVTNVLRHSQARTCEVTVSGGEGLVRLRVVNDGALPVSRAEPATPVEPGRHGSGLGSLAQRTGGRLAAVLLPGGRFEVVAEFGSDLTGPSSGPAGPSSGPAGPSSDPAGFGGDPDGVHPVASTQLGDG
ncbi:sensor histidine kinase [Nonomuraea aurantiaca]|uniref:sensor histidine kinase n=1 Tax=Nonomuraea aurantiaca TaxID=2878562 RepID=UPI001CD9FAD6|nr:histidine kinase [Nonomuraea aurantiaca]MCA2223832.1 histidine kinase [Nonomuraea aurantiaca]